MKKEDLKPYRMAQQLRVAANRCTRLNADVAMLCEHALTAAAWLEKEAEDIAQLTGSVTHNALMGRMTPGCILNETPNAEVQRPA